MKTLQAWVEDPGISTLEPFEGPAPARKAMAPEVVVDEEEERLKALELAEQPITTPKTIKEAVEPALAIPRGVQEAATTLGAGLLDLLSGYTGWHTIVELIRGRSPEEAMRSAEVSGFKPSVGWKTIVGAVSGEPPEVGKRGAYWQTLEGVTPESEVGQKITDTIGRGFELIREGAMVVGEQIPEPMPMFDIDPEAQSLIHDLAKTAVASGTEGAFYVLMGLIGRRVAGKPVLTKTDVQAAARLRKGGERYYPPRDVSPEARKLAAEIIEGIREPELLQKIEKVVPEKKVTPLERILEEEPIELVDIVKEPAERVVETQRAKEVARREKEAKVVPIRPEPKLKPGDKVIVEPGPYVRGKEIQGITDKTFEFMDSVGKTETKTQFDETWPKVKDKVEREFGNDALREMNKYDLEIRAQGRDSYLARTEALQALFDFRKGGRLYEAKPRLEVVPKKKKELDIREEPTVVTSEGIKADTMEALKGKTPEEAYEITRGIIEEFEDSPNYRFEDPFELINFREWTDELSGAIVDRLKKEGKVPPPEIEPPEVTLDFGGFQKMYESLVDRIKGEQPVSPHADEMLSKGDIIKQRKSRGRTFPPVYAAEEIILKNAKVLGETWLHRAFENPIRTIEEAGGELLKGLTIHPYHQAEKSFYVAWRNARRSIGEIESSVPRSSRHKIMAHALSKQKRGTGLLKASGIKKVPDLNPKELAAYEALRARYESLYRRLNQVRKAIGVEEFPKEADYFTFFRDLSVMERMGFRPLAMSKEILDAQFVKMRSRPFPFAKPRKGGIYKVELDPFYVLKNYEQKALRYMHISPLVSKMREYQLTMPDGWKLANHNPVLARALNDWTNHIAGQKSAWSLPPAVESAMFRVNSNLAAAILGANARSAAIQVTALRNTITEIGFGYTARGVESLIHPGRRNFALRMSKVLLQRVFDVTIEDAISAIRRGKIGAVQRGAARASMKPLQVLDFNTAIATWQGAFEFAAKELKHGNKKAARFADDIVTRTQASAMPGDIAPIQRPVAGRFLTLFQTFTINDWNFLLRDVLGIRNAEVGKGKAFTKAMRYVAATTLFNILFEDVLHINSPFPTPLKAFKESVDRGDELPSLAVNVGKEFIEPIPLVGAARYGKGPVGPAAELMIESSKWLSRDPMARPGTELLGEWLGVPGTAQLGKMKRARERGETPYGQLMGTYTEGGVRPARPAREKRPTRR